MTIRAVASLAGVSISTVSRFLNHPEMLKKSTRDRVVKAINEVNYVPNLAASALKSKYSRTLLLYLPDICNPFYSRMAKELQSLATENGFILVVLDTGELVENELAAIDTARQLQASGIFAASIYSDDQVVDKLSVCPYPVIGLNSYPRGVPIDAVGVHHLGGTNLAVKHLIELGHHHICFAGGKPDTFIGESRKHGYLHEMKKAGIPVTQDMVFESGFSQDDGYRAGIYFSTSLRLPTAICCANDLVAFGLILALTEMGINVPGAVSVTGMDDTIFASTSSPPLTSVSNDGALFARIAFSVMQKRIEDGNESTKIFREIPNELIVRRSSISPRTTRVL